jgi:type I restriction-modification system DNA methylase subunit
VYENTLVTPEIRKAFGTHSTPRPVAEYMVNRLELWRHDPHDIRIYEPCAGAGLFLVAALRQLRELLPVDWTDEQRHKFLVQRITGDEIDPFAKEVATLSLILADYPNANGWNISELDLFKK